MATILLSAAGTAVGGSIGGSVLGLSTAVIGRAVGATIGRVIDQRILGSGSEPVEVGRLDRFRLTGASEGVAVQQVFGRMRVPGQVIWATQFLENSKVTGGGGKGAGPSQPKTTDYSYSVSLAVALCEGEITRVGRIWADGEEIATFDLNMRVYTGSENQLPDVKISAVEGAQNAPAYRGIAYVVLEDLPLAQFGNRVPQFTFEVVRPSEPEEPRETADMARLIRGVAMIPGTGEYALAETAAYLEPEYGEQTAINVNTPSGAPDYTTSALTLDEELPNCGSVSLVVSWFGSDLRCGVTEVKPKVEQTDVDADTMPWLVSGQTRAGADIVPILAGRPVYGGTPADAAVIETITDLKSRQMNPVFYPFILMEQLSGNGLPDPYGGTEQAPLPWRGRITLAAAPGNAGSPDGTAAAAAQVETFMGNAQPSDFAISDKVVTYSGPDEWGYRRFILHYAHLCMAAGGVSAFCIGSEMRGLTQIRGPNNSFPAVEALRTLAAECRVILGGSCKISYAADWSEYHGYQPSGTTDKYFHLDPLWADPNIDFIGIDNYMPLSDWRDGEDHADVGWGSVYNLNYLASNVAGGEGFDWFYHSPEARDAQIRTPITDGDGEPWVWRYKDLHGWWSHQHHDRINGVRQEAHTAWEPQSKPFWFTEFGCAAIDKGTNQPNKFLDPKSSESQLPYYSNGMRDDLAQMQYVRAVYRHFDSYANNPVSTEYGGRMLDLSRTHVWAWDARPFPFFPANSKLWSDGGNYDRGHWLNGRASARTLASVVAEICERSGVIRYDVSKLYGLVRGYVVSDVSSGRAALQPLMQAYGFEAAERDGKLVFFNRDGLTNAVLTQDELAIDPEKDTSVVLTRASVVEVAGRIQIGFVDAEADYDASVAETIHPDEQTFAVSRTEFPLALTRSEGARIAARWTHEARVATDSVTFALPPSQAAISVGDTVDLSNETHRGCYRIDRIDELGLRLVEGTRVASEIYRPQERFEEGARLKPFVAQTPVKMNFLDLPLLTGNEVPHEPHVAASARPWPGGVALYSATQDSDYILQEILRHRNVLGVTRTPLDRGRTGLWDRQTLDLRLISGALSSAAPASVFAGANALAIGDGTADKWEIIQFAQAQPIAERVWQLSDLLRGQAGSDCQMPDIWPTGSRVVLLDGTPQQITIPTTSRGLPRHYRYGPVKKAVSDKSFRHKVLTFKGNGYRPYTVVHLRAAPQSGDLKISWIRRTRIDGDLWAANDVPLGEATESYVVRIMQGESILREVTRSTPSWVYSAAERAADVGSSDFVVAVAQISDRFGVGPFRTLTVTS